MKYLKMIGITFGTFLLTGCQWMFLAYPSTWEGYESNEIIPIRKQNAEMYNDIISVSDCNGIKILADEFSEVKWTLHREYIIKGMKEKNCNIGNSSPEKKEIGKSSENISTASGKNHSIMPKQNNVSTALAPMANRKDSSTLAVVPPKSFPKKSSTFVRGWLGIQVYEDMPKGVAKILNVDEGKGLFVQTVAPGSAAEKSGMRNADIILSVDGNEFTKGSEFSAYMSKLPVGHLLRLKVIRAQNPIDQIIELTEKLPSM